MRLARFIVVGLTFCVATFCLTTFSTRHVLAANSDSTRQSQISRLIQQLGSDGYRQRKFAESELRDVGHEAIDQLLEAQYNDSPEISLAAQQLLGQLRIVWARPDDPTIATEIMRGYDEMSSDEKLERVDWLSQLEDGIGFATIGRIVRYERSELVAKQAALTLMGNVDHEFPQHVAALQQTIESTLDGCERQPATWLRAFHGNLKNPGDANLQTFDKLAATEKALVENVRSTNQIAADLLLLVADLALRSKDEERAKAAVTELLTLVKDQQFQVVTTSHWLLDQGRADLFQTLVMERFKDEIDELPQFLYCNAETLLKSDPVKAQEIADAAFELTNNELAFQDDVTTFFLRRSTAFGLEERGLTGWAVREYQRLIAMDDNFRIDYYRRQAAEVLSELLHDRGRHKEAAETLKGILSNVADDTMMRGDQSVGDMRARMHYFMSEHHRKQADREKQIESLTSAVEVNPTDADVLIAMQRLPRADAEWKEKTREYVATAIEEFQARLQRLQDGGEIENRYQVALNLNQIAWLIGNTGELHNSDVLNQAVAQSRRSLELRPQAAGYLDTLGRAYFAVDDLDSAIKYQSYAVKLEPHTQQLQRQLKEFESSARERNSDNNPNSQP